MKKLYAYEKFKTTTGNSIPSLNDYLDKLNVLMYKHHVMNMNRFVNYMKQLVWDWKLKYVKKSE